MSYQHYQQIKPRYPEHVLIISEGETHTTYEQDAELINATLGKRYQPYAFLPDVSISETEIDRVICNLIAAGHRVAIAQREA